MDVYSKITESLHCHGLEISRSDHQSKSFHTGMHQLTKKDIEGVCAIDYVVNIFDPTGGYCMDWKYEEGRIFSVDDKNELMAETTFIKKDNGEVDIDHTFVNPVLRGQGVAGKMMEVVASHLREKGFKASASCSYANVWLKKHKEEYADIISDDIDSDPMACKIDSKH